MDPRQLYMALHNKAGFEKVNENATDKQIRFIGRVPQVKVNTWLGLVKRLLIAGEASPLWNVDISRQYFTREDKLLYGWRLIFQAQNIAECIPEIVQNIDNVQQVMTELTEAPLIGRTSNQGLVRGKGAQPITVDPHGRTSSAVVGPMAVLQAKMGG